MTQRHRLIAVSVAALLVNGLTAGNPGAAAEQRRAVDHRTRQQRFHAVGSALTEDTTRAPAPAAVEAPQGFDNLTNGYSPQGPDFTTLNNSTVVKGRSFNDNRYVFEQIETAEEGLGPTYNAQSCRECHQSVVTGGSSQIAEHRTGHMDNGVFFESIGGSLIKSRATFADIVEHVNFEDDISTFRLSTNTLGDGYVEAIANETILAIRNHQPASIRGTAVIVPVLEANSAARVGRFGWKDQHASLESFAADAYLNEMGITNPLFAEENTSSGVFVGYGTAYDPLPEPEDDGDDVEAFADFMRATKAPLRGPISADVLAGEQVFARIGCTGCHVASITTARAGTPINGGDMVVSAALGSKVIHPYSDYLMHDIGTGDGIPVLPDPGYAMTARQIRTAPLWGLRTRNRLMHDGLTFTYQAAIGRHINQGQGAQTAYLALSATEQNQVRAFLHSL